MAIAALLISVLALIVSTAVGLRQLLLARNANALPVLIDLLREHREPQLADARRYINRHLHECDVARGFGGLPENVRDLAWFYDHLGVLIAHKLVDLPPISGYLGGSVQTTWTALKPYVEREREKRALEGMDDAGRWQLYYENLARLVEANPPESARAHAGRWRLGRR